MSIEVPMPSKSHSHPLTPHADGRSTAPVSTTQDSPSKHASATGKSPEVRVRRPRPRPV